MFVFLLVRQRKQHPDPENGEQEQLREGQNGEGDNVREDEDGDLEDGEDGRPEEESGVAFAEETNDSDSLRHFHDQEVHHQTFPGPNDGGVTQPCG